jgi:hypothetical protein
LVSNRRRASASGTSSTGPTSSKPALLTKIPVAPHSAAIWAAASRIECSSVTSSRNVLMPAAAKSASVSGRRAVA